MTPAMTRYRRAAPLFPVLFVFAMAAAAQPFGSNTSDSAIVRLGQSAVPLYGPWKFTVGDSPIDPATKQPLWAQPDFDDSRWETVNLTPGHGAVDPIAGLSGYVPGWTTRGHSGYWGYAWYRIRVRVEARPGEKLAMAGPADMDDAYQAFSNGELAGQFGDFRASHPKVFYTQPVMFPLPQISQPSGSIANRRDTGSYVLAFRVWMEPAHPAANARCGRLSFSAADWAMRKPLGPYTPCGGWNWCGANLPPAFEAFLFGLLGLMAFSLPPVRPLRPCLAWMGVLFS